MGLTKKSYSETMNFQIRLKVKNIMNFNKITNLIHEIKDITQTSSFRKWFGDSEVVDEQGKPLKVYHGTDKDFNRFNWRFSTQGVHWFSSDKEEIINGESGANSTKIILSCYLKANKLAGWKEYDKYSLIEIRNMGFDGIKLDDYYIVFDANQIKIIGREVNEMSNKEETNLKRWFSNSKILDSDGKPLIVYHGTTKDFNIFDNKSNRNETAGLGYWFTNDSEVAGEFSVDSEYFWGQEIKREESGGNIKPVFLRMVNPKIYSARKADPSKVEERIQAREDLKQNKKDSARNGDFYNWGRIDYTEFMKNQREFHNRLNSLDKKIKELYIYTIDSDPMQVLMDDRDEFAYYGKDSRSSYKGFWRERMMAYDKDKTNTEFIDHLKSQG
jgi:hypothetical protein